MIGGLVEMKLRRPLPWYRGGEMSPELSRVRWANALVAPGIEYNR